MLKINKQELLKKLNTMNSERIKDIINIIKKTNQGFLIEYKDLVENENTIQFVIDIEELKNEIDYLINFNKWFEITNLYEIEF